MSTVIVEGSFLGGVCGLVNRDSVGDFDAAVVAVVGGGGGGGGDGGEACCFGTIGSEITRVGDDCDKGETDSAIPTTVDRL